MGQKVDELSAKCERFSTELFDTHGKSKQERKVKRTPQALVKVYSDQLDDIAKSDGKISLKPTRGQIVPFLPLSVRRTAIISLANLKGGVGKTTIAANLGAALAAEGLRVLLINLDHQSSLYEPLSPARRKDTKSSGRIATSTSSSTSGENFANSQPLHHTPPDPNRFRPTLSRPSARGAFRRHREPAHDPVAFRPDHRGCPVSVAVSPPLLPSCRTTTMP